jgi:hypothetical protein
MVAAAADGGSPTNSPKRARFVSGAGLADHWATGLESTRCLRFGAVDEEEDTGRE